MKVVHVLRKPLSGTVAANVQTHGTGALNIDGCRIDGAPRNPGFKAPVSSGIFGASANSALVGYESPSGRWPANLILQAGCPVASIDAQSGTSKSTGGRIGNAKGVFVNLGAAGWNGTHQKGNPGFGDVGGASRYFKIIHERK